MLNFDPIGATFNEINPNEDSCIFEETLESNLKKTDLSKIEIKCIMYGKELQK